MDATCLPRGVARVEHHVGRRLGRVVGPAQNELRHLREASKHGRWQRGWQTPRGESGQYTRKAPTLQASCGKCWAAPAAAPTFLPLFCAATMRRVEPAASRTVAGTPRCNKASTCFPKGGGGVEIIMSAHSSAVCARPALGRGVKRLKDARSAGVPLAFPPPCPAPWLTSLCRAWRTREKISTTSSSFTLAGMDKLSPYGEGAASSPHSRELREAVVAAEEGRLGTRTLPAGGGGPCGPTPVPPPPPPGCRAAPPPRQ